MELRNYLHVVVRRRALIIFVILFGLILGAAASLLRTPVYSSTASVLLQPNNPAERVTEDPGGFFNPDRYAADQLTIIAGEQVMARASTALQIQPQDLLEKVTTAAIDSSGLVTITVQDTDADFASRAANAVAESYIAYRRDTEVAGLERAAAEIGVQLSALTEQIAELRGAPLVQGVDSALQAASLQYTSLFSRQQDLLIDSTLKQGGAIVVSAATPATARDGVSLPAAIVLGGLLGVMAGLAVAFLREHLDDRVRGRTEVESLTHHPVLADLPIDRRLSRESTRLAMRDDPLGPYAEATRSLRTSISFLGVEAPIRRIMVSSAVSGEGKTVVAANLAVAFAQAGSRTLVVSADLRRPRMEQVLGVGRRPQGLSTVLAGTALDPGHHDAGDPASLRASLAQALVATEVADLTILPAGILPPNPAELLASPRMDRVLEVLEESFDIIVLDATPLVPVTDAAALASKVGHVLLVTSAGTSRRRAVERMIEITRLTDARVLGVALNRAEVQKGLSAGYERQVPPDQVPISRPATADAGEVAEAGRPVPATGHDEAVQPARTP